VSSVPAIGYRRRKLRDPPGPKPVAAVASGTATAKNTEDVDGQVQSDRGPDRAARLVMAPPALAAITFILLLVAFSTDSSLQPRLSIEKLERQIAETHRRESITLDDDIRALLAVRLGTDWSR
jgi:hypothetical protein